MPSAKTAGLSAPNLSGGSVKLDASAFGAEFNMAVVHEAVRAEQAARRQGTHSTKTRGEVRGGGRKPWKQKGSGRARAGSTRSPLWTGGGTAFGPRPRHHTFKVNRKARRLALRGALSVHAQRGSLAVFDAGAFDVPSTKQAQALLAGWGPDTPTLVVLKEGEREAGLSFRNLERVLVLPAQDAGVSNIVGAARLLVSQVALPELLARAAAAGTEAGES
ncbi:MAG: 50S ribosomal protein L4 [Solirubrobacteraceae bacterium]